MTENKHRGGNDSAEAKKRELGEGIRFRTGLWKRTTKTGGTLLTGRFDDQEATIFQNRNASRGEKDPVAYLKIGPKAYKDEKTGEWVNPDGIMVHLYRRKSKAGTEYMGGIRGETKYHVYPNAHKRSDNAPDFNMVAYINDATYQTGKSPKLFEGDGLPDEVVREAKAQVSIENQGTFQRAEEEDPWDEQDIDLSNTETF